MPQVPCGKLECFRVMMVVSGRDRLGVWDSMAVRGLDFTWRVGTPFLPRIVRIQTRRCVRDTGSCICRLKFAFLLVHRPVAVPMTNDFGSYYAEGRQQGEARSGRRRPSGPDRHRDLVYTKRVPAGRRTYFFDVKPTRSGKDFFIIVTESKRIDEHRYEKHKIFLYKEDFAKFIRGLGETIEHVRQEHLPDFEFHGLPELIYPPVPEKDT